MDRYVQPEEAGSERVWYAPVHHAETVTTPAQAGSLLEEGFIITIDCMYTTPTAVCLGILQEVYEHLHAALRGVAGLPWDYLTPTSFCEVCPICF